MSEWKNVALGDFGSFTNGINKDKNAFGKGVPFVNLLDIYGKESISREPAGLVQVTENEIRNYDLKKGDILFARSSVKPEGVGQTCVVLRNFDRIVYSGFIIRYRQFDQKIWYQYAKYCFDNPIVRRSVLAKSTVSANTNINQESLKTITVPLPPLPHQRKIARILTTVDSIIEKTEAAIAKYKAIKQGMMHDLFTRGIDVKTGKLRPKFEDAPELYKESELGWIPKEWEVDELGTLVETYAGGTPSRSRPEYFGGDIPWVSSSEVNQPEICKTKENITREGFENSSVKWVKEGSILIAMYGATAGKISKLRINATTNQAVLACIDSKDLKSGFIFHLANFLMDKILFKVQGSGQPNLSKDIIDTTPIFKISIAEQILITDRLNTLIDL